MEVATIITATLIVVAIIAIRMMNFENEEALLNAILFPIKYDACMDLDLPSFKPN